MRIEDKTLIIYPHDFDHIMDYSDDPCPSENFKYGLGAELFMNGLENAEFKEIKLSFERKDR